MDEAQEYLQRPITFSIFGQDGNSRRVFGCFVAVYATEALDLGCFGKAMACPNDFVKELKTEECVEIQLEFDSKFDDAFAEGSAGQEGGFDDQQNTADKALRELKGIVFESKEDHPSASSNKSELIAAFMVVAYIAVGIVFYGHFENWGVVDCIYFCLVIITTVGYGDLTPQTPSTKYFTCFFALLGMGTIGIALGKLAEWFLARQQAIAKEASRRVLNNAGMAAAQAANDNPKHRKSKKHQRRKQVASSTPNETRQLVLATFPIFLSILVGVVIGYHEGWDLVDCLYVTIITVTTIGFGDLSPQSQTGRVFAIFYLPLAVIAVANAVGNIAEIVARRKLSSKTISMKELIAMDSDGDGQVSKVEYLSYMLIKLGKVDQEEVNAILSQFNDLDADQSGMLDHDDLKRLDEHLTENQ